MERLHWHGPGRMREDGVQVGANRWEYPAHTNNYRTGNRGPAEIDQIVIHTAEGYTGGLDTFRDPDRGASAHYAVQWNGEIAQMVADRDVAWHAGGRIGTNDRSIGIEHAGFAYAMQPGTETEWSKTMLKSSAKLVAQLARRYGVPLDRDHIIGHVDVPDQTHTDPGPYWPWDWYLGKVRWYYYRPYVFAGLGVAALGMALYARRRARKRVERWKEI